MRVDYHMHLENGPLTLEYLEQFWSHAKKNDIDEIGISEHGYYFQQYENIMEHFVKLMDHDPVIAAWLKDAFLLDLEDYVDLVEEGKNRGWPLKLGLEMDYIPGKEEEIAALIEAYPWDYVLGSVHVLGDWCIDYSPDAGWPEKDINSAYAAYFTALVDAANSGLFDSITHPDLIKIFGHRPSMSLQPFYEEAATALSRSHTCVEINAAGLHKPVGVIYPHPKLLEECLKQQVPITLACDAHWPEHVGRGLDEAIDLAKSIGYTQVATFTRRKIELKPLG
ncbi:MAG: histidinol-phosphatase HisJ family protein [Firmicutes bacterium]|nr:histidinol-phosphatase HisJ family protein [Bacillota bacterium]